MNKRYLSKEEYKELLGAEAPSNFDTLLAKASVVLDTETRRYYQFNDLEMDKVALRKRAFKMAIAMQINFYVISEADTVEGMNNQPTSVRIGDTSVTYGNKSDSKGNARMSAVSQDALNVLVGTGLLYRGARL